MDLLRLKTLRGNQTGFLTPEMYDTHPHPFFIWECPWALGIPSYTKTDEMTLEQQK